MSVSPNVPGLAEALARAGIPLPGAGQLALVLAPPGVGKSALLARAALMALSGGQRVLHVATSDSVEHVRAHYDLALASEPAPVDLSARMIHSDRQLSIERLRAHLALLADAAGFKPSMVAVDGLDGELAALADGLLGVAREIGAPVWAAAPFGSDALVPELPPPVTVFRLRADRSGRVAVHVLDESGEHPIGVAFDADGSLLTGDGGARPRALGPADVTLYTGGAKGTEAAFGELAARWGLTEVNFTFPGHVQARTQGAVELSPRELAAGDVSLAYVSRRLGRTYSTEGTLIRKVLQTLWQMVSRSQKVIVVGEIQGDGTVVGGTGWSVELARMWNKDLWVYDQGLRAWHRWDGEAWVPGAPVIDAAQVAGTGTRTLEDHARDALEALFVRSFGPAPR